MAVVTVRGIALAAVSLSIIGCQGDLTLPGNPPTAPPGEPFPSSLSRVDGNGQEGVVGTKLPDPLRVRVTDATTAPVADVTVRFTSSVPGAKLQPDVIATDNGGYAEVTIRLGDVEGAQEVQAFLVDDTGLRTTFTLNAVAKDPPKDDHGDGDAGGSGKGDNGDDHHGGHHDDDHHGGHHDD